jgi:hypothetical protein
MHDPTTRCPIPWCGTHTQHGAHANHRAAIGTVDDGEPITVGLLYGDTQAGAPVFGPAVTVHWHTIEGEDDARPAVEGLDLTPGRARQLAELLVTAAARIDGTQGASGSLPADVGPYETEQQAADTTRDAYGHPDFPGHMKAYNRARLNEVCDAVGVELGAYDMRVLEWLAIWEPEVVAVVAGLIARAGATR